MICGQSNCYSNCHIGYTANIPHDLNGLFVVRCKCNHIASDHHRRRAIWAKVENTRTPDDLKKWESAQDGTEKTAILVAVRKQVQEDLDQVINGGTSDLATQVGLYGELSLSGSFSVQVASAVRLLEQTLSSLESNGVGRSHLERVAESLANMKRKLDMLKRAKEAARKERVEIGNP